MAESEFGGLTGLTSDLPPEPPAYPGKPLSHRYTPTETTRLVETPHQEANLAGTSIKPVAALSYTDKNLYIGEVKNTQPRKLNPTGFAETIPVPGQGTSVQLSEDIRNQLSAQVKRTVDRYLQPKQTTLAPQVVQTQAPAPAQVPTVPATAPTLQTLPPQSPANQPAQPPLAPASNDLVTLAQELEKINQSAKDEIARTRPEPTPPLPKMKTAPAAAVPATFMEEAAKIEAELQNLQEEFKKTPPAAGIPTERKDKDYLSQISKLVADKTALLGKVNQLTSALTEETTKRLQAEYLAAQAEKIAAELGRAQAQIRNLESKMIDLETSITTGQKEVNQKPAPQDKEQATEESKPFFKMPNFGLGKREEPKTPLAEGAKSPSIAVGKMAPSLTNAPNVINGIVKDTQGLLMANVIIVVKDGKGEPVRALKTNKIGQFAISTPLPNGVYTMELEAPGHTFDLIQVDVSGEVLPPIEIRANH